MGLFHKEFKQIISNRLFVALWIVIMIIMTMFMCSDKGSNTKNHNSGAVIGIVNSDDSSYSAMFMDFITDSAEFAKIVTVVEGSKNELEKMFMDGKLDAYVEIPDSFISNIVDIDAVPICVKVSDKNTVTAILVSNIINSYQDYINSIQLNVTALYNSLRAVGFSNAKTLMPCIKVTYKMVTGIVDKEDMVEQTEITDYKNTSVIRYAIFAAITFVILYGSIFAGVDLIKEKNYKVLNRYLVSGKNVFLLILVKTIFYSLALYLLVLIPTIVSSIVCKTDINWNMMFLYITFILFSVSMSILISFIAGEINGYAIITNIMYMISCIIGGGIIPVMYLPDTINKIGEYTPTRLFIKTFINVYNQRGLSYVLPLIITCYSLCLTFTFLSAFLLKKGAGKVK